VSKTKKKSFVEWFVQDSSEDKLEERYPDERSSKKKFKHSAIHTTMFCEE
jgi:hypothetical protein